MDAELLAGKLSGWIKEKVLAAGCKGAVLGMSGGIDSSVVAGLCAKVFPDNTLGLILPCHSIDQDKEHAELAAKKFKLPTKLVALDNIYDSFLKRLPDFKADPAYAKLAQANLKARLRMVTLFYTANQLKYLVIGSGNKSELTVGYFTKYGDSGVDLLPIGNLVKKEVRELARYLKVPPPIIDKAPSAGLWAGRRGRNGLYLRGFRRIYPDRQSAGSGKKAHRWDAPSQRPQMRHPTGAGVLATCHRADEKGGGWFW
jgi:NAD+ synthase